MSDVMIAIIGVVVVVFVVTCVLFSATRAHNDRRQEERLSIAFARAQAIRMSGIGAQGSPYSLYTKPIGLDE